jgi:predicted nucleic-acid-binding protein
MLQSPKLAILQSLDAMDKVQMEEVLLYIKSILNQSGRNMDHKEFKKEAMKEIRKALRQEKKRALRIAA